MRAAWLIEVSDRTLILTLQIYNIFQNNTTKSKIIFEKAAEILKIIVSLPLKSQKLRCYTSTPYVSFAAMSGKSRSLFALGVWPNRH